ncbi:SpnB-like Rossmann fold domain-containing protein [Streptomyces sp. Mo3]|uniref:SpnB-like Rossmann fold domain-containing protein n=1 Tax=Streptomyces sp. Mo3 TaxID=3161190 RepID=UPI0039F0F337
MAARMWRVLRTGPRPEALELIQTWLADERFADARLTVLTSGAVATERRRAGGRTWPGAAVWGLLRSAQSENPGRLGPGRRRWCRPRSLSAVAGALGSGEPQVAATGRARCGHRVWHGPPLRYSSSGRPRRVSMPRARSW